ncbi:MAG: DUF1294 domain-containing protein [Pelomonas sp.]|nr:DUF1294 domain-containing protein [Roseateles sp.]
MPRDTRPDPRRPQRRPQPTPLGAPGGLLAIPLFVLLFWGADLLWNAPPWGWIVYAGASALAFIAYVVDKWAARAGASRISESALLTLGLLCGWPGALLGQQLLRHKTAKPGYLAVFWASVVLNVAVFLFWVSPLSPRVVGEPPVATEAETDLAPISSSPPGMPDAVASGAAKAAVAPGPGASAPHQ